jgi:hypothetical protein
MHILKGWGFFFYWTQLLYAIGSKLLRTLKENKKYMTQYMIKFIVVKNTYDYTLDSHFGQVKKDT